VSGCYRVTPYAVKSAKKCGVPVITILQDFVQPKKLKRFLVFCSSHLVAVSKSIEASIHSFVKKEITTVYNGIDVQKFCEAVDHNKTLKDEWGIDSEKRIVGLIANFIPLKRHRLFLDAMQKVAQEKEDVVFVIVGGSPDEKQLSLQDIQKYACRLGIEDRVIFTGFREDVPSILNCFDILVLCSFYLVSLFESSQRT